MNYGIRDYSSINLYLSRYFHGIDGNKCICGKHIEITVFNDGDELPEILPGTFGDHTRHAETISFEIVFIKLYVLRLFRFVIRMH